VTEVADGGEDHGQAEAVAFSREWGLKG